MILESYLGFTVPLDDNTVLSLMTISFEMTILMLLKEEVFVCATRKM